MLLRPHAPHIAGSPPHTAAARPGASTTEGRHPMELLKQPPPMKLPAEWFTGDAYADVIHRGEEPSRMRANKVRFTPGDVIHSPPGEEHWHGAAPTSS